MTSVLRLCIALVLTFALLLDKGALAQSPDTPSVLLFRSQMTGIAEEMLQRLKPIVSQGASITIAVEPNLNRTLIENAFLDVIGQGGYKVTLTGGEKGAGPSLQVLVLRQSVQYTGNPSGGFGRRASTVVEARLRLAGGGEAHYLGSFSREAVDTVSQREEIGVFGSDSNGISEASGSFFERIAGPILAITGAFLIVYLFFTVRS